MAIEGSWCFVKLRSTCIHGTRPMPLKASEKKPTRCCTELVALQLRRGSIPARRFSLRSDARSPFAASRLPVLISSRRSFFLFEPVGPRSLGESLVHHLDPQISGLSLSLCLYLSLCLPFFLFSKPFLFFSFSSWESRVEIANEPTFPLPFLKKNSGHACALHNKTRKIGATILSKPKI